MKVELNCLNKVSWKTWRLEALWHLYARKRRSTGNVKADLGGGVKVAHLVGLIEGPRVPMEG
jgi:hypothetical protein